MFYTTFYFAIDAHLGKLSFEEDMLKGEYVSGMVNKINNPEEKVIRSAVPVKVNGKVVAMLYGIASPELYEEKYVSAINKARLCVIDDKGNFVINTVVNFPTILIY